MLSLRTLLVFALIVALGCSSNSSTGSGYAPTTDTSDLCTTPLAPNEPLCSTAFSDPVWPASHRGSYAQGSSALSGPTDGDSTICEHLLIPIAGVPVGASCSEPYEDERDVEELAEREIRTLFPRLG